MAPATATAVRSIAAPAPQTTKVASGLRLVDPSKNISQEQTLDIGSTPESVRVSLAFAAAIDQILKQ